MWTWRCCHKHIWTVFFMRNYVRWSSVANCDDTADKESDNAVYCVYIVLDLIIKVDWHKIHITLREGCRCCHVAIKSKCIR